MRCRSNDYFFVNMEIKTDQPLEQGRVYEFTYDGKDFVLLQAKNRKERRSYKYASQPSYGIKQIDQNKNIINLKNF